MRLHTLMRSHPNNSRGLCQWWRRGGAPLPRAGRVDVRGGSRIGGGIRRDGQAGWDRRTASLLK
ncbi:MAG: hypothetical protein ACKO96_19085 [Flammeovirgaceae bacterium]